MSRYDYIREADRYDYLEEVRKFNPYHDERGRFASAPGGMSVAMGVGGSTAGGTRSKLAGTLSSVEKANMDREVEVATIVNVNTGKVIFSKEGGAAGVSFNSSEVREIAGQVLTHNHPDEVIFSPADVAMAYHVNTIRATTPSGSAYELSGVMNKAAVTTYNEHYMAARAESFKKLGIAEGTLDRELSGELRAKSFAIISESCERWLAENAQQYGYHYDKGRVE